MIGPPYLLGATDVHPYVRDRETYVALHRMKQQQKIEAFPRMGFRAPWRCEDRLDVFISGGVILIRCACGNAPVVERVSRIALCFTCGAIYQDIDLPIHLDEIERVLCARPMLETRHWARPETVDDLQRENIAHGVEARA